MMGRWHDVCDYEGIYQVSDTGCIKRTGRARGAKVGRVLKPHPNNSGYLRITLCRDGGCRYVLVHRLVAEAFLGPAPSPKHEVNHKNGNKTDNRAENLEWVTTAQNHRHSYRVLGRVSRGHAPPGEANGSSKLTKDSVIKIRQLYAVGTCTQRELGRLFGVSRSTVGNIVRQETWQHA